MLPGLLFCAGGPIVLAGTSAGGQWAGGSEANETIGAGVSSNIHGLLQEYPRSKKRLAKSNIGTTFLNVTCSARLLVGAKPTSVIRNVWSVATSRQYIF